LGVLSAVSLIEGIVELALSSWIWGIGGIVIGAMMFYLTVELYHYQKRVNNK
jgi:hypothetical protein